MNIHITFLELLFFHKLFCFFGTAILLISEDLPGDLDRCGLPVDFKVFLDIVGVI